MASWIDVPDLGFELERRIPNGLIEEEQARPDRAASITGLRIGQRILKVDIEVGDACKYSRRLPPMEPMPGRHQAELAVELAQRRFRQAFDQRLAILPFCPVVADQQMTPSFKAVFESLAPGNLYDICLYDAPFRQSATRDIGGRKLDDRGRSRGVPCQAATYLNHDICPEYMHRPFSSAVVTCLDH